MCMYTYIYILYIYIFVYIQHVSTCPMFSGKKQQTFRCSKMTHKVNSPLMGPGLVGETLLAAEGSQGLARQDRAIQLLRPVS